MVPGIGNGRGAILIPAYLCCHLIENFLGDNGNECRSKGYPTRRLHLGSPYDGYCGFHSVSYELTCNHKQHNCNHKGGEGFILAVPEVVVLVPAL